MAFDSQTIPDGPIWARESVTNRTLVLGEASGATSRHTRMEPNNLHTRAQNQTTCTRARNQTTLWTYKAFKRVFKGIFQKGVYGWLPLNGFSKAFKRSLVISTAGLGVIFTAGLGVISTAGLNVIFTAGLGVIFTAGPVAIFTAGLGIISTAGLGVIFTAGLI